MQLGKHKRFLFKNPKIQLYFFFFPDQDLNSDRVSVSSLGSGDPDCSSLIESDSCVDPDGLSSPQRDATQPVTRPKRSPYRSNHCLESPSAPPRLFRQSSLTGECVAFAVRFTPEVAVLSKYQTVVFMLCFSMLCMYIYKYILNTSKNRNKSPETWGKSDIKIKTYI